MAFVNEFVSEEDVKQYGLKEIDRKYRKGHYRPDWTIDREKNLYLREVEHGREEWANQGGYTFYWKGVLLFIRLVRKGGGMRGGECWTEWSLLESQFQGSITGMRSEELEKNRAEIIADLKDALTAYKDFGVRSSSSSHTATFTF